MHNIEHLLIRDIDNKSVATKMDRGDIPKSILDIPVVAHVGPHKTGTTWFQKQFLKKSSDIVYEDNVDLSHHAFITPDIGSFNGDYARDVFSSYLRRAHETGKPLVISDEALGGRPFGQRHIREITALRIHQTFPQARIILTIREQCSLIGSMYSQYLRYGYYSGLKEFLDENTGNKNIEPIIDRKYYEYDRTFDLYSSIFGADQVYAIPMEMMVSRPEDLAKKLSEATGKKVRVPDSTNTSIRENAALSGWAKKSLRIANRFVPQDSRWTQKSRKLSPNSIASKVNNITPNWIRRRQKLNEQELICRTLGKHYADSNRRLGNIIGIDLASLGYET